MVKPFRRYAKVGLLLAMGVVLLGNREGCQQMAVEAWADLPAQLNFHQEQLDSQQEQICDLYEASTLDFPPECIELDDPPPGQDVCVPTKNGNDCR